MKSSPPASAQPEKLWYTVKELSQEWGISEGWIRGHAKHKEPRIQGRKFGKFIKFHRDDINEFLDRIAISREHASDSPEKEKRTSHVHGVRAS